jgi:hypothetical protein
MIAPGTMQGQEVPPVLFTGPLANPGYKKPYLVMHRNDVILGVDVPLWVGASRSYTVVAEIASLPLPVATMVAEYWLGNTPIGGFAALADMKTSFPNFGPGLGLNWYPWEGIHYSVRLDLLQRTVSSSMSISP